MNFMNTLSSSSDVYRPTLFELVAQDKMSDLLKPALRFVLVVYAQRYPRYLLRLVNYHDEFYALLMWIIEGHYLKEYGGSFSEYFYGLKRSRSVKIGRSDKLTRGDKVRSLLALVALPYAKGKLDELYENVSGGAAAAIFGQSVEDTDETGSEGPENESIYVRTQEVSFQRRWLKFMSRLKTKSKKLFKITYPWINAAFHGSKLLYQIGYLYNLTDYWTPWLHLLRIEVKRMSWEDYREMYQKQLQSGTSSAAPSSSRRFFLLTLLSKGIDFLKILLPMSLFFFKFLEWWYNTDYSRQQKRQEPIPKPPELAPPHPKGLPLPQSDNTTSATCPICQKPVTNPTATTSGYVFCYPCIFKYVEKENKCPVTWESCTVEELRRLYDDAEE
ncbi:Pex12 amino terminal region-domain-containing protein [Paraphysoderma sedebokerense]|nr:Pex12 amino terminal region-domain-containing protein [Paraphysoderma sedebokerense]